MELHTDLKLPKRSLLSFSSGDELYRFATDHVQVHRQKEVDNIWKRVEFLSGRDLTEEDFTLEYAWVVYVSGFKASQISSKWDAILRAHLILDGCGEFCPASPQTVLTDLSDVFKVFKNKAKAEAIKGTRHLISGLGWPGFYEQYVVDRDPVKFSCLRMIGPALSRHLARNLGNKELVKPDVHLNRLAQRYQFSSAQEMCEKLDPSQPPGKTDLILWFSSVDCGTK